MDSKQSQTYIPNSGDSDSTIPTKDEPLSSTSDDCYAGTPSLQLLDSSDAFTFLEDIEPPSLFESSCDNCPLNHSTYNSMCDQILQEKLVSISSTDDKFESYMLSNSREQNSVGCSESPKRFHSEADKITKIGNNKADICGDVKNISCSSTSTKEITTSSSAQTAIKLNSTNLSSSSCETEALRIAKILLLTGSSTSTVGECESCLDLDLISDSILGSFTGSTSGEDSVFFPTKKNAEESPSKAIPLGESYIVNCDNGNATTVVDTICDGNKLIENIQNENINTNNVLTTEGNEAISNNGESKINSTFEKSPINATYNTLPDRRNKVNRTFDKCPGGELTLNDKPDVANGTIVLARNDVTKEMEEVNETVVLTHTNVAADVGSNVKVELANNTVTKDIEEITEPQGTVEELSNGLFLMRGEEFNLMDMEASDLRSVLSQTNNSRRSLQNKNTPSSSCTKRMSLTSHRRSLLKDSAKADENKVMMKKLDINQLSTINLFKAKLRGASVKKTEERKGPMKATYVPENNRLEESPKAMFATRAISSPAGTKVRCGSKSDSEYSGPPMPSFGSVSTIDSDRPSTPDLGISETPEVFRGKGALSSRMTSTPSMKFDILQNALKMPDFPTPILAPVTRPALRKISESLSTSGCDETESTLDNTVNVAKCQKITKKETSKAANTTQNDVTLTKKNAGASTTKLLHQTKSKARTPDVVGSGKSNNKTAKADKENLNQAKPRASISGLPLKGRILNPRKPSNIQSVAKPLSNRTSAVTNKITSARFTGRTVPKTGLTPEKKPLMPRSQMSHQPPRKSTATPVISKVQLPQRKSFAKPMVSAKVLNSKVIPPPKPTSANVKVAEEGNHTARMEINKRSSVIPRPSCIPKLT